MLNNMLYTLSKVHEILVPRLKMKEDLGLAVHLRSLANANYGLVLPVQKETRFAGFRIQRT